NSTTGGFSCPRGLVPGPWRAHWCLPRGCVRPCSVVGTSAHTTDRPWWAPVAVGLGGAGRAGAALGVQAQQARAVLAHQLHAADDLRDRGLLLDLLVHEPVQQRAGVVVALLVGAAVQLADRLGDLLLVRERRLEDPQHREA